MEKKENQNEVLPILDFSSIVLPFFTQALIKLGKMENPTTQKMEENLEFAKRLIDLLDLLKKKTEGNLTQQEKEFLDSSIYQLRMAYMEKVKIIKL
ncbi:MAG: DUF1844 domain-containing protein [Candidatus Aminicenantia bacterium]